MTEPQTSQLEAISPSTARQRLVVVGALTVCVLATVAAFTLQGPREWEWVTWTAMLVMAVVAGRIVIPLDRDVRIDGSFPIYVLAAVMLGPAPAVALILGHTLVQPRLRDVLRGRRPVWALALDLAAAPTFALILGLLSRLAPTDLLGLTLAAIGLYILALPLNQALIIFPAATLTQAPKPWRDFQRTTKVAFGIGQLGHGSAVATVVVLHSLLGPVALVMGAALEITAIRLQQGMEKAKRDERDAAERAEQLNALQFGALESMMNLLSLRTPAAARHAQAVSALAGAVASRMQLSDGLVQLAQVAGRVHDIGRAMHSDEVLAQTADHDSDRAAGASLVQELSGYAPVAEVLSAQSEHFDGSGGPVGLAGEQIPVVARILAVVEAYDLWLHPANHQRAISPQAALVRLRAQQGTRLDPEVVQALSMLVLEEGAIFVEDLPSTPDHDWKTLAPEVVGATS